MKPVPGIGAIRMAALSYARHGKRVSELMRFIRERIDISRAEILRHCRDLGIEVEYPARRLRLPKNVTPFWRGLPVWKDPDGQREAGGSAA